MKDLAQLMEKRLECSDEVIKTFKNNDFGPRRTFLRVRIVILDYGDN